MDYFHPLPTSTTPIHFNSSILILPQPSLSSLPQLAVDLLVHNLNLKLVGYFGLQDYVPAVGGLDSLGGAGEEKEGITFSVEVYQTHPATHTFILPRSPIIQARKAHHLASLISFVQAAGFSEVLLVAGVDKGGRGDEGIRSTTPLRHYFLPSLSPSSSPLHTHLLTLPPYIPTTTTTTPQTETLPNFPAAGLTRSILSAFLSSQESQKVSIHALLIYVAEGDNALEAERLAGTLCDVLDLDFEVGTAEGGEAGRAGEREWKKPGSWKSGLMGPELGRERGGEMFG